MCNNIILSVTVYAISSIDFPASIKLILIYLIVKEPLLCFFFVKKRRKRSIRPNNIDYSKYHGKNKYPQQHIFFLFSFSISMFIALPHEFCKMLGKDKTEKCVRPFFDPFQRNFKNPSEILSGWIYIFRE